MTSRALLYQPSRLADNRSLLSEARRFWCHESGGELGYRCYEGDGLGFWQAFTENAVNYYVLRSEVGLIANHANELGALARNGLAEGEPLTLIELGTGSEASLNAKTSPIVKALRPNKMVVADHSSDVLVTTKKFLQQRFPDMPVDLLEVDFNTEEIAIPREGRRIMLQFGSTISNVAGLQGDLLPFDLLVSSLRNFRQNLASGDLLVIGYDSNQEGASATVAYDHPDHAAFSLNLLDVMARDPAFVGLDSSAFFYQPTWHKAASLVSHDLVAKRDGEFWLDGERMSYKTGESFNYSNSYKYPVWVFEAAARKAGLEPYRRMMDGNNQIGLHVLRVS